MGAFPFPGANLGPGRRRAMSARRTITTATRRSRFDAMSTTAPAPTKNERLLAWVDEVASLTKPEQIVWCDGSAEEYDRLCASWSLPARSRSSIPPNAPTPTLPVGSDRRRARGRPHVHLLGDRGGGRPDEQLDRSGGNAHEAGRSLRRLHARPHDVRRAVLDGPARLADRAHRRGVDRLPYVGSTCAS